MKPNTTAKGAPLIIALAFVLSAPAWSSTVEPTPETEDPPETSSPQVMEPATADEADVEGEQEPSGLDIVMDGSSLEAWNESMEEVKEVGGMAEYNKLQKAFDYLLLFDIGAKNDPATLASRLDGLTGRQILDRVKYRMSR